MNVNGLPEDVNARYLLKQENKIVLGPIDGTDCLIFADGSRFLLQSDPRGTALMRDLVNCKALILASGHGTMQFGLYINPIWCYPPRHAEKSKQKHISGLVTSLMEAPHIISVSLA